MKEVEMHPCYDASAKHKYARVHLPVAPKCNIQCNYCNRKYDCVNESRPGVTSTILTPEQAAAYTSKIYSMMPNLKVVGIAGPGDPFANATETMQTLRLIKKQHPDLMLCVSSNGLEVAPYIDELADLGVNHLTLTINAIDPEILSKIYSWVRFNKKVYRGLDAGKVLSEQQLLALALLTEKGIKVKINSIILPGINELEIPKVAEKVSLMGAHVMNCIPVIPNAETPFGTMTEPNAPLIEEVRNNVRKHILVMSHCSRCRADAVGLLGKDLENKNELLKEFSLKPITMDNSRTRVAIATEEGILVNQHLGEAERFQIFEQQGDDYNLIEVREAPRAGLGDFRWLDLSKQLKDCKAILVGSAGPNPVSILESTGLKVIQMTGLINQGLDHVYKGTALLSVKKAENFNCSSGGGCKGNAMGCG